MKGNVKGRNSVMIGIRVSVSVNAILEEMAKKKGITVSAFVKGKVEEYARLAVHTIEPVARSVNKGAGAVNTMKDVLTDKDGKHYKLIGGVRCRIKE